MTVLSVEVEDFVCSAVSMASDVAEPIRVALGRLSGALESCASMAGSDPAGAAWSSSYDPAAHAAMLATAELAGSAYVTSAMFGRSGMNYAEAEAASTTSGSMPASTSALLQRLPGDRSMGPPAAPPSAAGGSGDAPFGWSLVQSAVGYVWPNGHQDRLRHAARAWRECASAVSSVSCRVMAGAAAFDDDRLPEAADIDRVCRGTQARLMRLASAHSGLAEACDGLATHIDQCHDAIRSELIWLTGESAVIQGIGGVLSVFSLGTAEVPTQATQGGRIALAASRIARIIERLVAAARRLAGLVAEVKNVVAEVRTALQELGNARLAYAGATHVPAAARTARVARTAGGPLKALRMTREAKKELEAAERLAAGKVARPMRLNDVDDPRKFDPSSLRGMKADDVKDGIPHDWEMASSRRGSGTVYRDPRNRGRQIRVMDGYPPGSRPDLITTGPYVVVSQAGRVPVKIALEGNPTL